MDLTTILVIAVALGVVLLTSLFKVVEFSTKVKQVIAVVVSTVGGGLTAFATGRFDSVQDVLATVLVVYGLSQAIYQFLFDNGRVLGGLDAALEDFRVGDGPDLPEADHVDEPVVEQEPTEEPEK